jgi:tripartite ATP-independent transporter DctM subunit
MELAIIGLLFLGTLLALYAIGVPVAVAMGLTCLVVMLSPYGDGINLGLIGTQLLFGLDSFTLLAIPFYLFLGRLMNHVGMTRRIFRFASALVGQFRGGIAQVNILASMIFAGMSGLAVADAAGLGRVEYRAMRDQGYGKSISLGVSGSSAIIGPILPPSVPIIIYAVLAEESISELFLAGLVPGLLLGALLMVLVVVLVYRRDYDAHQAFELQELKESFLGAFAAILTPIIIIVGILSGYFTATEAGAVSVVYVILVGIAYGELTPFGLYRELRDSMVETFALTFIVAVAALYGLVALQLELPILLADGIGALTTDRLFVLLLLVVLLLVVGTFMETIAAITVLVPILLPVIDLAGIDPVHFGIVMILTLMLGLLTPPFGVILFVLEKVTDATLEEVMYAVIPFYVPILIVLMLIVLFPDLATYVPFELMPG